MKYKLFSLICLILLFTLNCENSTDKKRKIKLATRDKISAESDISQTTTLKFDANEKQSIAILTFDNQTGDQNLDWLCKGITDMLIRDFSQSRYISVITLQRVFDILKQLHIESSGNIDYKMVSQIGKYAKVKTILRGTFTQEKNELRISANLFDVNSGKILQTQQVTGEGLEQIFSMVDELTDKVKSNMIISMKEKDETIMKIADITTTSLEAYRNYTEGVELVYKAYLGDAIEKFENAIKIDSTFAMAHFWLSIIYSNLEKIDFGKKAIMKAVKLSENVSPKEKMKIDWIYAGYNNETEKAFNMLKNLVSVYPDDKNLHFYLASRFFLNNEVENADSQLDTVLLLDPEFVQAYNMKSIISRDRGDYKQAIKNLHKYIDIKPDEAAPYHNLAEIYEINNDYKKAINHYNTALSIKPDFFYSKLNLANVYSTLGDYEYAKQIYLSALEIVPNEELKARVYSGLTEINMAQGKYKNALANIDKALQYPSSKQIKSNYLVIKSRIYYRNEQYDSTKQILNKALNNQPQNLAAYALLGRVLLKTDQVDSAKKVSEKVGQIIEELKLRILKNVHMSLQRKIAHHEKRYDEAISYCLQILDDNPEANSMYFSLGKIYDDMNKPGEAIKNYLIYIKKNPKDALIHYHLALAYKNAGKDKKAKKSLNHFLKIWKNADQDIPEIIKAKKLLNEWENAA